MENRPPFILTGKKQGNCLDKCVNGFTSSSPYALER